MHPGVKNAPINYLSYASKNGDVSDAIVAQ